jgi:hypothetical protein
MHSASSAAAGLKAQFASAHQLVFNINSIRTLPTHQRDVDSSRTSGHVKLCRTCNQQLSDSATSSSRRSLLAGVVSLAVGGQCAPPPAQAALVQFPCAELRNKYVLVRAGESYSESQDTILTNPAWKTSMAARLSERGKAQASAAPSKHSSPTYVCMCMSLHNCMSLHIARTARSACVTQACMPGSVKWCAHVGT